MTLPNRPTTLQTLARRAAVWVLAIWTLAACSAEKETLVARNWHNLLAYYNSYFLAKEKLRDVELSTWSGMKDNYNRPLAVLPPPGQASSQTAALDEIVKKASIPIQRHKNSNWVDDSYLLIGKARYYQDDYENAVHTFKYLNAKAKDEAVKHAAMVWLLRTYTDMKEYSYARQATEAALSKVLNPQNRKDFYLAMAHYHSKFREWPEVLGYVEEALPLMRRDIFRGRMEFLAGQLRQRMNDDSAAYKHYAMVARCKPTYELAFNAQVNAAQTMAASDVAGAQRIRKYFRKQLKDEKNLEYKDKIYYEMARFELKQNDVAKALEYDQASLKSGGQTVGMKGYAYLLRGQIYYEKVKRYDLAKLYYDSAVAALDTTEENYKAIVKRQKVLKDFVEHYQVIQKEDSLRGLAALDSISLNRKLTDLATAKVRADAALAAAAEKAARKAEREEANRLAAAGNGLNPLAPPGGMPPPGGGMGQDPNAPLTMPGQAPVWYFYNQAQVARGKQVFQRKWGRRPLEDNWRRAKKEMDAGGGEDVVAANQASKSDSAGKPVAEAGTKPAGRKGGTSTDARAEEAQAVAALVATYRQGLPTTKEALKASDDKLQPALFAIGKIYDQNLEEPGNALASFARLTSRYPDFDKDPEALYNLYRLYQRKPAKPQADSVKRILVAKHPTSVFAKLADDPEYLAKNRAQTEAAKGMYRQAYESYKQGRYIEASTAIASIRRQYPENSFRDRVDLLAALLAAKTIDPTVYKDSLQAVAERYPKSDLQPTLKQMIATADKFGRPAPPPVASNDTSRPANPNAGQAVDLGANARSGPAQWEDRTEGPHVYIAILTLGGITESEAQEQLKGFNDLFYPQENLTVSTTLLNDQFFLARAGDLRSKLIAKLYLDKQQSLDGAFDYIEPRIQQFIITAENYRELMRTRDLAGYKRFFDKAYSRR